MSELPPDLEPLRKDRQEPFEEGVETEAGVNIVATLPFYWFTGPVVIASVLACSSILFVCWNWIFVFYRSRSSLGPLWLLSVFPQWLYIGWYLWHLLAVLVLYPWVPLLEVIPIPKYIREGCIPTKICFIRIFPQFFKVMRWEDGP